MGRRRRSVRRRRARPRRAPRRRRRRRRQEVRGEDVGREVRGEEGMSPPPATHDPLQAAAPPPPHSVSAVFAIPAFRTFWVALGLSSLGDWAGLLALTALANELAGADYAERNFAIAGVLFLRVLPALVIGPLGGYLADLLDRRLTLVVGSLLRAAIFCTIPLVDTLWWLLRGDRPGRGRQPGVAARPRTRRCPTWCRASGWRRPTRSSSRRRTVPRCRRPRCSSG